MFVNLEVGQTEKLTFKIIFVKGIPSMSFGRAANEFEVLSQTHLGATKSATRIDKKCQLQAAFKTVKVLLK